MSYWYKRSKSFKRGDIFWGVCKGFYVTSKTPGAVTPNAHYFNNERVQITLLSLVQDVPCGQVLNRTLIEKFLDVIKLEPAPRCFHSGWICTVIGRSGCSGLYLISHDEVRAMEKIGCEFL